MKSRKIKKLFAGVLALIMCVSLTGCMDKKVKTITVNLKDSKKVLVINESSDDLAKRVLRDSTENFKLIFSYKKDSQKLKKVQMTFVIDTEKAIKLYIEEFKKTSEYKELEKQSPVKAEEVVGMLKSELKKVFSKDTLKEKENASDVKKLSNGKLKITIDSDKGNNKKDIRKVDDIDKTTKAIKKTLKKDGFNSKDYTIKVKNY